MPYPVAYGRTMPGSVLTKGIRSRYETSGRQVLLHLIVTRVQNGHYSCHDGQAQKIKNIYMRVVLAFFRYPGFQNTPKRVEGWRSIFFPTPSNPTYAHSSGAAGSVACEQTGTKATR